MMSDASVDNEVVINRKILLSDGNSSTSSNKRRIAEMKLEQAKRRQEFERRRLDLEMQQADLRQQMEIQILQDRVAEAELESTSSSGSNHSEPPVTGLPGMTSDDKVEQYLDGLRGITDTMKDSINLPKPELLTFNGDPLEYCRFICNFETNIESCVSDDKLKLSYLIQFCRGSAKSAIEDCVVLPPLDGYIRAKEILRNRYGKTHLVVRSHVERLINGPTLRSNDIEALMNLSLDMEKCQMTLAQLGFSSDINNTENLRKIVRRLPNHIRSRWVEEASKLIEKGIEPAFKNLLSFIQHRASVANTMYGRDLACEHKQTSSRAAVGARSSQVKCREGGKVTLSTSGNTCSGKAPRASQGNNGFNSGHSRSLACVYCGEGHKLINCDKFKTIDLQSRIALIQEKRMCENCLNFKHDANSCRKSSSCSIDGCREKHHTLLHKAVASVNPDMLGHSHCCTETDVTMHSKVSLRIVPVIVQNGSRSAETYALLDEGSDITLCSESLVGKLGAKGVSRQFTITTVNQTAQQRSGTEVQFKVSSIDKQECLDIRRAWSVPSLPISVDSLPTDKDIGKWKHLAGIKLPQVSNSKVELLIGSDCPEAFWVEEERRGARGEPYAIRSPLGWTIFGPTGKKASFGGSVNFQRGADVHDQIHKLWTTDFPDRGMDNKVGMSQEDHRALSIMEGSMEKEGKHYKMGLPWRDEQVSLPSNKASAATRLGQLKRKLTRDSNLKSLYCETMNGYIEKGYAEPVKDNSECKSDRVWYLPHHPVCNPNKPGKVRIVFDCAARYQGTSLNDNLLQGPDLVNSLVGVLIRFREQPVALVADIEAMFHQVKVSDKDRDTLRFLWWPGGDMERPPTEYCMTVHLFGATSSPSCAAYSLKCTAKDNAAHFTQETVKTVERNFYVDDLLKSVPNAQVGIELSSELRQILSKGGFKLTKWISNKKEVSDTFPESERASQCTKVDLDNDKPFERALGLHWYIERDTFVFDVDLPDKCHTRRGILSVACSLYDPLGLVAPVTLIPKLILQNACRQKLQWDEKMCDDDVTKWSEWLENLPVLSQVSIDRCFQPSMVDDSFKVELHMFSDASEYAYGAAVYIKIYDDNDNCKCSLVMGKSRLAPIKAMSIPRLELTAAAVAVKLYQLVSQELDLKVDRRYFWTDSMIVLGYIKNETRRFKTFVANRLAMIHDVTSPADWRYVLSEMNPADIASRGLSPNETERLGEWLTGPDFIQRAEVYWPKCPQSAAIPADDTEIKQVCSTQMTQMKPDTGLGSLLVRSSNWHELQRSVAWLLRFKSYLIQRHLKREVTHPNKGPLTVCDLREATKAILSLVQKDEYSEEIKSVLKSGYVTGTSAVVKLSPVFTDNLLKVGGRLENASLCNDSKHQVILPGNHHVTKILIRSYHETNAHMGAHHILSLMRQKYWILPGLRSVKSVLSKCMNCRRLQQRPETQQMGQLPVERLEPDKPPFSYVGVDFFGPMYVKSGRKQLKRYGCLFTCLCTRAVHIEITHSLNTDSFIGALQRFESRRGRPEKIFSDNGTNLTAGEKELRESIQRWNQGHISKHLNQKGIAWHFNPPYASHMGGVWERLVRSVKQALKSVVREQLLCDEALSTLVAEVEKIMNDRPITQVSDDHRDPRPLTPNTLLLLRPNMCFPPGVFDKSDNYGRRWWRQVQYLTNIFWRRWMKEYLPTLQVRQTWHNSRRNLAVNDLVLVCDETSTRGQWPLGVVREVSTGRDGLVRSCKVKVNGKEMVRPIAKLCLLEHNVTN